MYLQVKAFQPENGSTSTKVKVVNKFPIMQAIIKIQKLSKRKILLQELEILLKKVVKCKKIERIFKGHKIY